MKIFISKYQMKKKGLLNAKDSDLFQSGALIKVVSPTGSWGVADLCPWPQLGDWTLDEELLQRGVLFQQSVKLAQDDLHAREKKLSLLQNKPVSNNWLITDYKSWDLSSPLSGTVKVKGDSDLAALISFLGKISGWSVRIRLDFNGSLAVDEFDLFLSKLSLETKKQIEYIEDPTVWNAEDWTRWNQIIPLGLDFTRIDPFSHRQTWSFLIIKPSRQNADELIEASQAANKKFTLTSSMDHPVGLAHGLRWAQAYAQNDSGFMTLENYEPTAFHSYFTTEKNTLNFTGKAYEGEGIGMTDDLEKLEWISL